MPKFSGDKLPSSIQSDPLFFHITPEMAATILNHCPAGTLFIHPHKDFENELCLALALPNKNTINSTELVYVSFGIKKINKTTFNFELNDTKTKSSSLFTSLKDISEHIYEQELYKVGGYKKPRGNFQYSFFSLIEVDFTDIDSQTLIFLLEEFIIYKQKKHYSDLSKIWGISTLNLMETVKKAKKTHTDPRISKPLPWYTIPAEARITDNSEAPSKPQKQKTSGFSFWKKLGGKTRTKDIKLISEEESDDSNDTPSYRSDNF